MCVCACVWDGVVEGLCTSVYVDIKEQPAEAVFFHPPCGFLGSNLYCQT